MPGIKLVVFDMDGTITRERSSWEYLHRRLGIWEGQAEKYQEQFLAGEISYEEFCRLDAAMWRGLPLQRVEALLSEIPLRRKAAEVVAAVRQLGAKPVLLSTGLQLLADRLAGSLGFWYALANELVHHSGILTGQVVVHVCTQDPHKTKGAHLRRLMDRVGASPAETVTVGDSDGDLEMFREAGLAVAVDPAAGSLPVLREQVPRLVTVRHLAQVIPMLYDLKGEK